MPRFLLVGIFILGGAAPAWSRKLSADVRVDYKSSDYSSSASDVGRDNLKYYLQMARLDYVDNLSPAVTLRVRWRISGKNQTTVNKRDSTNSNLDLAYLSVKANSDWTLQAGKIFSDIGGFEGAIPGHDIYYVSEGNSGTSYLNAGTRLTGADTDVYYTGAKAIWSGMDSWTVAVHSANSNTAVGRNADSQSPGDKTDGGFFAQTRMMSALVVKSVKPQGWNTLVSYHLSQPGAGTEKAAYSAIGIQWNSPEWIYQMDLLSNDYQSKPSAEILNDHLRTLTHSIRRVWSTSSLILRQNFSEELIAGVSSSDVKNRYIGYGVAYECLSSQLPNLRYHLAFQLREMEPESGARRHLIDVIAGFKLTTDLFQGL